MREPGPVAAVVAVTLNCNARCVMCDIWKNELTDELRPEEYAALPASLRDINVSGGEPFLRDDLPEIVAVLRRACPRARLVISTHGFLTAKVERLLAPIVALDPRVGLRVSLDAVGERHDAIRGVPGGFERSLATLEGARRLGVRDLGIAVTLMERNVEDVRPLYRFARERRLAFSVTVATDSEVYFGPDQARHRPAPDGALARELGHVIRAEYRHPHPKRWFRAWYEGRLLDHLLTGKRPLPCDAARRFFYLDSKGTVYACNARDLRLGSLREASWRDVWEGDGAGAVRAEARACRRCWMVCTAKTQMRAQILRLVPQVLREKVRAHLGRP